MNNPYGPTPQFNFNYPGIYSPGQMAFNNNTELSQLITMFSGPLLGQMAGPGNFLPHMMPTQQLVDQFALRNYQNQTRNAAYQVKNDNTQNVANGLLGLRSAVTKSPATELNREQAANMAGMLNDPMVKGVMGMLMGPENVEAAFHGSKGDVSALGNTINRIGYYRQDPSGVGRMDADSLADYTRGTFAQLYEPQGNLEEIEEQARSTNTARRTEGRKRLKRAAKADNADIVEDADVASRLESMDEAPKRVEALYKKYVSGGKATDTKQQAQELVKFERAIAESGVLKDTEMTVGGLIKQAEKVPVNEMHGFMAGQVGQIAENMFQRGMLPQALGSMSPADRVRMIHQTPLDEENLTRISREMARRDLSSETNSSEEARQYRALQTEPERERFVNKHADNYRDTLQETRRKIEETATGASGAMSATDLEKLQGFEALSGNVDAKRSAESIKKYTGAVAAIRDIFGDNGNPNAPLPALLAALEGLTGGAVASMKPQKIEATLRQMQTVAKEAGIGFEQMAAMSTQIDSLGQSMNLTPADTMRVKANAMVAMKVSQDTGAFANPIYGQVDKGRTSSNVAEAMTKGAASHGARAMAALETIYKNAGTDPKTGKHVFAGTELEAALEAYRNNEGDGTYVDPKTGEKKNLRQLMARPEAGGIAKGLAMGAGVTEAEYSAQIANPLAMENSNEMFSFLAQTHGNIYEINEGDTKTRLMATLKNTSLMAGKDDEGRQAVGDRLGTALAGLIFETSGLEQGEQITQIQQRVEDTFRQELEKTMSPAQAAAQAKEAAAAVGDRRTVSSFVGGANTVSAMHSGKTLSEIWQYRGEGRDQKTATEAAQSAARAERRAFTAEGYEGTPVARASDYLQEIGRTGENFNVDAFARATLNGPVADRTLIDKYAASMKPGFDTLTQMKREALITNSEVERLSTAGDVEGLRRLGGVKDNVNIISNAEAKTLTDAHIAAATKDDKDFTKLYKTYFDKATDFDAAKLTPEKREQYRVELQNNERFRQDMEKKALGPDRMSAAGVKNAAMANVGTAHAGQEQLVGDLQKIEKAMLVGNDKDALREGVYATYRALGLNLSAEQADTLHKAIADRSEGAAGRLTEAISGVQTDAATKEKLTNLATSLQSGIPLDLARTMGISQLTDKELTKELTAHFTATGAYTADEAERKAKETAAAVQQKRDDAAGKKVGAPTVEATRQETQTQLANELAQQFEKEGKLSPEEAKKKADETAATIMRKTDESVAQKGGGAGDARQQRVDTLEVNAQTVVIKSGKVDGAADAPTRTSDAPARVASALGVPENITDALGNLVPTEVSDSAKLGLEVLKGVFTKPDSAPAPVADQPAAAPAPAPEPAPPEPEKVQEAGSAQIKNDTGNAVAAPQPPAEKTAAPAVAEPVVAAIEEERAPGSLPDGVTSAKDTLLRAIAKQQVLGTAEEQDVFPGPVAEKSSIPLSMEDAVNTAIQSPSGQAVLTGASALYEELAPDAVKKTIAGAMPVFTDADTKNFTARHGSEESAAEAETWREEPFQTFSQELGAYVKGKTTVENDELIEDRVKTETPAAITGSPLEQIMYGLSKGYLPQQTFGRGTVRGVETEVNLDELVTDRLITDVPEGFKDQARQYAADNIDKNDEQYRLQKQYVENHANIKTATDPMDREAAMRLKDNAISRLGVHNAARAAGIDTKNGAYWDESAQTINGVKVNNEEVEKHIELLRQRSKEKPESLVSDAVKDSLGDKFFKAFGLEPPEKKTPQKANEEELKKTAGISSANVTTPETKDVVPSRPDAGTGSLAQTLPDATQASSPSNPVNRVQSMPASAVTQVSRSMPAESGTGAGGGGSLTINGTLALSGLQEAILSAQGARVMQTDGGPPVVIDPMRQQGVPAAPKTYG